MGPVVASLEAGKEQCIETVRLFEAGEAQPIELNPEQKDYPLEEIDHIDSLKVFTDLTKPRHTCHISIFHASGIMQSMIFSFEWKIAGRSLISFKKVQSMADDEVDLETDDDDDISRIDKDVPEAISPKYTNILDPVSSLSVGYLVLNPSLFK